MAAARDLVQAAKRQPALRQAPVQRRHPEGQHRTRLRLALEIGDAVAKRRKSGGRSGHDGTNIKGNLGSRFVLIGPACQLASA